MISMIGHAIFGLIVGLVARFLLPGPQPKGIIVTALVGIAGGWLGGFIGKALGWYKEGEAAGFLMSVVGAMALYVLLRFI
jgi:uncharacterized membrane protein YeaQ/YmgE (transglycosylase-associated protein family)